jgi:3-dehydroquinate synthase
MNSISINIQRLQKTNIFVGVDISLNSEIIKNRNTVIISDSTVYNLYPEIFKNYHKIIIPQGENEKNLNRIEFILGKFIEYGIDKNSLVIGFGGGVICDIAGFAASIYMRGCNFGFIASTLLAQVDAAIGGKNGVNLGNHKNYIGVIKQPEFVICDVNHLQTLKIDEYKSGLAEVIKYALIADKKLFKILHENKTEIIDSRDQVLMQKIVETCIKIKKKIITEDPDDNYLRHILNFGHSFGHAIEISERIKHGMAIAKGMKIACEISVKRTFLSESVKDKIIDLLKLYEYDLTTKIGKNEIELLKKDKKKNGESINFILLEDIGKPKIEIIDFTDIII